MVDVREMCYSRNMSADPPPPLRSMLYACPHCAQEVEAVAGPSAQSVACPNCGTEFIIPAVDGSTELPDTPVEADEIDEREKEDAAELREAERKAATRREELDGLRIHQLVVARRSAYRGRSYTFIAMIVCAVGVVQLVIYAIQSLRYHELWWKPTAYFLFAGALVMATIYFLHRTIELHREVRRPTLDSHIRTICVKCGQDLTALPSGRCPQCGTSFTAVPPPPGQPDFSSLSDGSQFAKHLEDIE